MVIEFIQNAQINSLKKFYHQISQVPDQQLQQHT
jgi:hypothetical protein